MILSSPTGRSLCRAFVIVGLFAVVVLGSTACRSAQSNAAAGGRAGSQATAPVVAPMVSTRVGHFMGTPLSGPTTRPAPAVSPATAYDVRVAIVALGELPAGGV